MADKIVVKAEIRNEFGKNVNRRLRADGKIPVVVYGGGTESVSAAANIKELAAILRTDTGVNTVFSLDIEGDGMHDVIFQDRQIHPVKGRLIHADLRRFSKGEKIEMVVPIHFMGEPEFDMEEGMMVSHNLREIKLLTEPAKAPDAIEVDLAGLTPDHSIHVSDLKVPAGSEIHELPETVVASITVVKEVELEPQVEEGAEPEVVGESAPDSEGGE